ncbi:MAG TPA: hydrogenase maturation protease [Dermatophilaceae bacterium]|nr:hydrogenase maturation protease [Dermatophilaceae bacterium]
MSAPAPALGTRLSGYDDPTCLVVGVGNVGREDDGLGWAFVDRLEETGACARAEVVQRYQLLLEDADLFSRFERVLVVDATRDAGVTAYGVQVPEPRLDVTFTSHAMSVPCVLATTATCFGRVPQVEVLAIRGYSWDLCTGLTDQAAANLDAALDALGCPPPGTGRPGRPGRTDRDVPALGACGG